MCNNKVIAIDARMIEMSGIGTYIQHLMGKGIYDYALGNEEDIRKYDKQVKVIPYSAPIYGLKEQCMFPNAEVKKAKISLIHFPHYNVPRAYRGRFVVTVHDLTHIILPEFLGNKLKYLYAKTLMKYGLNHAEHIFTVSTNSKEDICRYFNTDEEKISITYNAVDADFRVKEFETLSYLYKKYGISTNKKIILYVGNLKPHKNLQRLLYAFATLNDSGEYCLVLAGKAFSSLELKDKEIELGIEKNVIHTGMVSKEELIDLYNLADVFAFPSLYEGFGIPPLEAMACGTPVVSANNSSLPEVVGDAAVMVDALNIEDIAKALKFVLGDELIRKDLINKGLKRKDYFSWDKLVEITRDKIDDVLQNEGEV